MQSFAKAFTRSECLINGQWCSADDHSTFDVLDPASGDLIARVPAAGTAETERAIAGAEAALPAWRAMPAKDRAEILQRWAKLILTYQEDLAKLITSEQGKPYAEAHGEVTYSVAYIEWFAEQCKRIDGEILQSPARDRRMLVLRQPVGVCAAITPWNFPLAMLARKIGPALAAGCTMIVKPAELTPLTALALGALAMEAGVPAGVLQVITGRPADICAAFCSSPVVRKISFTGSTGVGRLLMTQCASTIKKLSLELGGNAPFIVFADADLDRAVEGIMASKFRNSGQTCVCANRIYVQSEVYDDVAARLVKAVSALRPGKGTDPASDQGPLINEAAVAKVLTQLADAVARGAEIACGGKRHELGGTFFEPTVVKGATQEMMFAHEEIFGPVAPLYKFHTEAEVVAKANDTIYGLAAYVYTQDHARMWRLTDSLECGMVAINTGLMSSEVAPFGGIKQSGLGREGSRHGIEDYLEFKYVCVDTF
jgi:succinate-semialdehyde dehydrogenase/glutarate-semialdehyde dehydrogenase